MKYFIISLLLSVLLFLIDKIYGLKLLEISEFSQRIYLMPEDICQNHKIEEEKRNIETFIKAQKMEIEEMINEMKLQNIKYYVPEYKIEIIRFFKIPEKFPKIVYAYTENAKKYSIVLKGGFLFGRVKNISEKIAEIITIFSPDFYVEVIFQKSGERAILKGGEKMEIFLRKGMYKIEKGDIAITTGETRDEPKGIPVGEYEDENIVKPFATENILYGGIIYK